MAVSSRLLLSLFLAALVGIPSAQAADNLNDFLAQGYRIVSHTQVVGLFHGCEKDRVIQFRDKTVFSCNARNTHNAYAPSAFILETNDVPPRYAVIIDGKPYSGSLSKIFGKTPRHPVQVAATATAPSAARAVTTGPRVTAAPLMPQKLKQPASPEPRQQ